MLVATSSIQGKKLKPRGRKGTKTFLDIPRELRKKDLTDSVAGKHFKKILPPNVWEDFSASILDKGIESEEALRWLKYATSNDSQGNPISPIAQIVKNNPYDPKAFEYLYGEKDALTPADVGYILTSGAHAIDLRLQGIVANLPSIIKEERARLRLRSDEKYIIYNIGSGHCLDTVYTFCDNPGLMDIAEVICIDPDITSLSYGKALAKELGVEKSFKFIPEKIENAKLEKAHLILFIGMFCPVSTKKCILTLNFVKRYLFDEGVIIFSTVQEKMLMEGALLDFIMWSYGWRMFFKSDNEPGRIAETAGLKHEKLMDWEDELGYNRMTVARKKSWSFWGFVKSSIQITKTLMA
ncbi:MAG: hypothetical protein KAQ63_01410 [Candidatus Moranbacteria bacterium]|nr:hypothetical protein [Candidatus Moranbacteria bacterium]